MLTDQSGLGNSSLRLTEVTPGCVKVTVKADSTPCLHLTYLWIDPAPLASPFSILC